VAVLLVLFCVGLLLLSLLCSLFYLLREVVFKGRNICLLPFGCCVFGEYVCLCLQVVACSLWFECVWLGEV
jgi:hypothetical protein